MNTRVSQGELHPAFDAKPDMEAVLPDLQAIDRAWQARHGEHRSAGHDDEAYFTAAAAPGRRDRLRSWLGSITGRMRPSERSGDDAVDQRDGGQIGGLASLFARLGLKRSAGAGSGDADRQDGPGGGGSEASRLQQRTSNEEFRDVLGKGLAQCRSNLVAVAFFSFVINLLVLAIPIYLFNLSDRVLTSRSLDTLAMLSVVVCGAIAINVVVDIIRRLVLMRTAVEVESRLGAPVLSAAAKAAQAGSSKEFQTLADLQMLRGFITGPVLLTMFDAPVAPVYLLAVFLIHPDLGFIVTGTGILLLVVATINQRITAVPFGIANAYATRANLQADAMARNAQVINAMGMIPESVNIWGRETAESLKAQVIAQDRNIMMAGITKFVRMVTQISILGWGTWLALHGGLTGGMVIAGSIVASRALAPIEGVIEGWKHFVQAKAAYGRIRSLLLSSPLNIDRLRLPRPQGLLHVERILYVPPPNKKVILNGITFTLQPGESLAVVGPSGTGKSTLGKMLVGSITPTAGNVRLDMMDLRNWDPRQFGESVGYLPQDVQLFPASIKANIARMREDATDEEVFSAAELADVHDMISEFAQGYETQIGMDGSPLSGGQKQRIGLARAFYGNPRLVVLDEPNSNLDTAGEQALARAMARAKQRGTTVVAITQRPALLNSVDKIMILNNGSVQAFGPRADVLPILSGTRPAPGQPAPAPAAAEGQVPVPA
ncbi:type I secretion system permease/ATPase [uncultured Alsobacter sp.]|uniref:type I secretion system permease/ATPase n=1 Tax=uncultured Alsobacter sp. TaxID=1748258 RepID=UPI0025F90704|nr:type I secretion system permease/ATPase [uncultured Alsobacter sp.]